LTASTKTVLRSIRLSAEQDRFLEEEAEKKGLSVNSLLTNLITKYVEWDRNVERFGFVTVARQGFRQLIDSLNDEALVVHGREVGGKSAPDITRFWFGKLDLESFLSFIAIHSKYSGIYQYEIKSQDRSHTITFHHELGPRYNIVLSNYFDQAIRNIVGAVPRIETGNSSFVISFTEPGA
jgi:hypothetical protein